ncbi:MAG TPA: DUF885 family protein [Thermoanaerobaculia bacterium]|jgi:uncharacterized protein (DUF885 family)|nr:DUF885 family protein [Thermoanaerobaculia bacterium]
MRPKLLLITLLFVSTAAWAAPASKDDLQARRDALNKLLAEQWEYGLSHAPEFASILGDKRWNDQVSDFSQAAIDADLAKSRDFLRRFEGVDTTGFPEQEVLNKELMVRGLKEELAGARFRGWLMPVNQMGGIHLMAPQFPSLLTFTSVKDYDDLITRYKKLPRLFDQTMDHMREGMAAGLMPPKFLLEKVTAQVEGIAATPPEKSPFAQPLEQFPKEIPEAEQKRIRTEMLAAIRDSILPAYVKFGKFVKEEYAPKGRTEPGMWSLPDGAERYAWAVKQSTTSNLTPEEIHQLGLREVTRIEGQMLEIAKKLGYQDLKSFNAAIEADPKLKAQSRQQILDLYTKYIDQMWARLPELFGRLPKAKVEVKPVEEFREKEASGAQYIPGAPDGSRPGRVQVNTGEATSRKTISMESTAYHEGVPGHHMQLSIAQELPTLPPFRQQGGYTSFAEGWALYSERLGKEVGFYQDPYSDYGHLQDEMLRAIRLVVDTGFHYKHWTRNQVVQFFHDHSAIDEVEVQSETDRYIVWPGQALAYKIGQLKILELRERAKAELGPKFDIRKFHDTVLDAGALPLDVLEKRINNWIAAEKT